MNRNLLRPDEARKGSEETATAFTVTYCRAITAGIPHTHTHTHTHTHSSILRAATPQGIKTSEDIEDRLRTNELTKR